MAATVPPKLAAYKQEAATSIDAMYDLAQQMVDSVFSFGEIGFQEFETQRYLTASSSGKASPSNEVSLVSRPRGQRASALAAR